MHVLNKQRKDIRIRYQLTSYQYQNIDTHGTLSQIMFLEIFSSKLGKVKLTSKVLYFRYIAFLNEIKNYLIIQLIF